MKGTFIKSTKQLPEWFKIENYKKAEFFTVAQWCNELMFRLILHKTPPEAAPFPDAMLKLWEIIKSNGLLLDLGRRRKNTDNIYAAINTLNKDQQKDETELASQFSSIKSLKNFYMYHSLLFLDKSEMEKVTKYITELCNKGTTPDKVKPFTAEALKWANTPFDNFAPDEKFGLKNKYAFAQVLLEASDEQLKNDFAQWLTYERKRRDRFASKKNFSDHELLSWHEFSILPYLDLTYWEKDADVKINKYVIAQAIFSDAYSMSMDYDPLGKLKTTKKKAEYLMDYQILRQLDLQGNE